MELYSVRIPLPDTFFPSWIPGYPQNSNHLTFLRLVTEDGIVGESAGVAFAEEAKGLGTTIAPFFLTMGDVTVEKVMNRLTAATFLGLRLWWVEPAVWDLLGKYASLPVHSLLGGGREKIPAYASLGEVREPARRVEDVLSLKEAGFRAVKLRAHSPDWREDVRVLEAVRKAVGSGLEIMVDANQGWRIEILTPAPFWDLAAARNFSSACEALGVRWLEEPLNMHNRRGLRELRRSTPVPIAGGEMNSGFHEFRDLVEERCLDILQPDATLSGGISTSMKVASLCEAHGLGFAPHTWTNGIGLQINLHVMAAVSACSWCEYPYDPPGWVPEARDALLTEPIRIDADGNISIPKKPGLGIDIDGDKLKKYGELIFSI